VSLLLAGFFASDFAAVRDCGWGEKEDAAAQEGHPDPSSRSSAISVGSNLPRRKRIEEIAMPTYVMLTNLTAEGVRTLKNNPGRVAEVNKEVEQIGAKVQAQYATLGQYDFVTIVEAPDEKTMAKVSVELGSRGTMTSQTLTAMPADELSDSL
jgi:uncharacterized protein with GYD domain